MIDVTHVHPMLVHFPIVLFIIGLLAGIYLLLRGEDLAQRECLPMVGVASFVVGVIMAFIAATFGDMALDAAIDKGFAKSPLEEHEELATMTMVIFSLLTVVWVGAMWKGIKIRGAKALLFVITAIVGVGILLSTAYRGGNLVYKKGVNVELVKPHQ